MSPIKYSAWIFFVLFYLTSCHPRQASVCDMGLRAIAFIEQPRVVKYYETPDVLKELREKFKVINIDSTGKLYFIYARSLRSSNLYMIISPKNDTTCVDVKVGNSYPFLLGSLTKSTDISYMHQGYRIIPRGDVSQPQASFYLTGYDVKDICFAYNLSGLCITDKPVLKTIYVYDKLF